MGSQQVLRAAALVAVTAVSAATYAQPAAPASDPTAAAAAPASPAAPNAAAVPAAPAGAGAPVVVIDLTGEASGERAASLRQELRSAGFAVMSAPDLDAVNAGVDGGKDLGESLASLELARSAFGALDCPGAVQAAETAIATLAARAASGVEVTAQLTTAWSYLLLCRDRSGDFDGAMRAAQALRQLAPGAPASAGPGAAIPDAVWSKYPAVDVTANRDIAALTIDADPGAVVMIDHRPAGTAPAQVFVPAGRHLVAAAQGSRRAALWIDVTTARANVALRLFEQDAPLSRLAERVAAWKSQPPAGSQIATYLENLLTAAQGQPWNPSSARSPLLIILGPRGTQLWASDGPGLEPTATEIAVEAAPAASPAERAAPVILALRARALLWRDRGLEPDQLLVESRDEVARQEQPRATQWWVYAAIAGAVVVGGAVIVANELSEDTQRVELRFP